jgi:hypothetical protein
MVKAVKRKAAAKAVKGAIHIGVGGWTYEPWRDSFYPAGLAQKLELEYASRRLSSIEINGTYYGAQKPATFAKWHADTPAGFVFSVKAPRFVMNRSVLADAGATIARFLTGGVLELKDKLGPINWSLRTLQPSSSSCRSKPWDARCAMPSRCGMTASAVPNSSPWRANTVWPS